MNKSITLNINPRIEVDAVNDTLICYGDSLNINSQMLYSGAGSLSYDWSPGIDMSDSSILNSVLNSANTGYYKIIATDITNCSAADSFFIDVNPELSFNVSGDSLLCFNDTTFQDNV